MFVVPLALFFELATVKVRRRPNVFWAGGAHQLREHLGTAAYQTRFHQVGGNANVVSRGVDTLLYRANAMANV